MQSVFSEGRWCEECLSTIRDPSWKGLTTVVTRTKKKVSPKNGLIKLGLLHVVASSAATCLSYSYISILRSDHTSTSSNVSHLVPNATKHRYCVAPIVFGQAQ